jgi:hypothetical protein
VNKVQVGKVRGSQCPLRDQDICVRLRRQLLLDQWLRNDKKDKERTTFIAAHLSLLRCPISAFGSWPHIAREMCMEPKAGQRGVPASRDGHNNLDYSYA